MKRDVVVALVTYLLLFVLSFVISIGLGFGEAEGRRELSSLWMYGRRVLMAVAAIAIPWVTRKEGPSALGWGMSPRWFFIALGVGFFMGIGNRGGFNPLDPVAIPLALLHTFAMEVFFRGYLFRTFERVMGRLWIPLLLSSLLYALFYLTVWATWTQPLLGKVGFVFLFTGIGTVFGYSYKRSGSFLVDWMMHFFAVLQYRMLL